MQRWRTSVGRKVSVIDLAVRVETCTRLAEDWSCSTGVADWKDVKRRAFVAADTWWSVGKGSAFDSDAFKGVSFPGHGHCSASGAHEHEQEQVALALIGGGGGKAFCEAHFG